MAEHVLLLEHKSDWKSHFPRLPVISAREYLSEPEYSSKKQLRVINLCRGYKYLSIGYYCSLLAEARGHKVVPTVRTMQDLSQRSIYTLITEDMDALVQKALGKPGGALEATAYELTIQFGQCEVRDLRELARQLFEAFPSPLLRVEFRLHGGVWRVHAIRALPIGGIGPEAEERFFAALDSYLSRRWQRPRARKAYSYDIAILHNPSEELPPSDERALSRFVRAGKTFGANVELIVPRDFGRVAEYDALFIRETTRIDHHTYRFAKKADSEGMPVIDDPDSILRCTNKVYLAELLTGHRVPTPGTQILRRENLLEVEQSIPYPIVLKIPDGSFSRGVFKCENRNELQKTAARLFKDSELLLGQEFMYTEFDWRIGILDHKPLYACKYFMSKRHWQIYRHDGKGGSKSGAWATLAVEDAPPEVVQAALKAANLIGDGFYGVDLKQTERGVVVIEVNDNPSVEAGVEDKALGKELYEAVIGDLIRRLDQRRRRADK